MATISLRNINPVRFDYNVYMMSSVGIGTTSPGDILEAAGAGRSVGSTNYNVAKFESTTSNKGGVMLGGTSYGVNDSALIFPSVSTGSLILNVGLNGDTLGMAIQSNGNVGIGTTTPKRSLHIHTSSAASCFLQVTNGSTGSSSDGDGFQFGIGSTGGAQIIQRENLPLTISTNNTERLIISAVGEVGIGTASPGEKLHLVTGGNTRIRIDSGDSSASSVDLYDNGSLGVRINCDSTKNLELMAGGRTGADMIVLASNGNVGIGTTAPATELQIGDYTDAAETITIATSDNGTGRINFYDKNATEGGSIRVTGALNGSKMHFANRWNTDADKITFDLINGKVGIGTTSPATMLDIHDSGGTGLRVLRGTVDLRLSDNTTNGTVGTESNHNLYIRTNATDRITITNSGLVGIGTSSPAYALDVNGTLRCNTIMLADGTSFSSVGQVGMKAIAVNIGNGNSNVVGRAQSIVNASYGGIQNGLVVVYYYWHYSYGCGNGTCGATAHRRDFYQVVNGVWSFQYTIGS